MTAFNLFCLLSLYADTIQNILYQSKGIVYFKTKTLIEQTFSFCQPHAAFDVSFCKSVIFVASIFAVKNNVAFNCWLLCTLIQHMFLIPIYLLPFVN